MRINRTTYGNRNINAASVLNKVDYDGSNPVGLIEGYDEATSSNFGTVREPRRGGCYKANNVEYINSGYVHPSISTTFSGTISVWIDYSIPLDYEWIFGGWIDTASRYGITINPDGFITGYFAGRTYSADISSYEGQFIHIAFTNENFTGNLYINGVLLYTDSPAPVGDMPNITFTAISIRLSNTTYYTLHSKIFDLRFFLYELSEVDINRVMNFEVLGTETLMYKLDENSDNTVYDSSGNELHGIIIDAITVPPEQDANSIHQYQDIKSWHNDEGYSLDTSGAYPVYIPKDESITILPYKDVLGNDLQFINIVPSKASFVDSACWLGDGISYLSITGILTTDTVEVYGSSDLPAILADGELHLGNTSKAYGVTIRRATDIWAIYPLCEPIINSSAHTYYDISGNGNHATLINGTVNNQGSQDEYHWLQQGFNKDVNGNYIPALAALNGNDALSNPLTLQQDGKNYLNDSIAKLRHAVMPRVTQADIYKFWEVDRSFNEFNYGEAHGQYFVGNRVEDKRTNITLQPYEGMLRQTIVEKVIREVGSTNYFIESFVITVSMADAETMVIPATSSANDFVIDWGDGTVEQVNIISPSHTYTKAGEYQIVITGVMQKLEFRNIESRNNIISIENLGNTGMILALDMFYGSSNLISVNFTNWNVSGITSLQNMFSLCTDLVNVDMTPINLTGINSIIGMFASCTNLLSLDVSTIDTSNVLYFNNFVSNCTNLSFIDTSKWDVHNAISFSRFAYSSSNLNNFDTSGWNVSNVTDFSYFITFCSKITELKTSNWNVSNVTTFYWFSRSAALEVLDVSGWKPAKVTTFYQAFFINHIAIFDISNWGELVCIDMTSMLYGNNITTIDLNGISFLNEVTLSYMLGGNTSLENVFCNTFTAFNVINLSYTFYSCSSLTTLDVNNWDVSSVTTFSSAFSGCSSLTTLDVGLWDVSACTDFSSVFSGCSSLTDIIGFENWDVSACTYFANMMINSTLPTSRYDALLNQNTGWVSRGMQDGVGESIHFGNSTYSLADADAVAGKAAIEAAPNNWVITDGGGV